MGADGIDAYVRKLVRGRFFECCRWNDIKQHFEQQGCEELEENKYEILDLFMKHLVQLRKDHPTVDQIVNDNGYTLAGSSNAVMQWPMPLFARICRSAVRDSCEKEVISWTALRKYVMSALENRNARHIDPEEYKDFILDEYLDCHTRHAVPGLSQLSSTRGWTPSIGLGTSASLNTMQSPINLSTVEEPSESTGRHTPDDGRHVDPKKFMKTFRVEVSIGIDAIVCEPQEEPWIAEDLIEFISIIAEKDGKVKLGIAEPGMTKRDVWFDVVDNEEMKVRGLICNLGVPLGFGPLLPLRSTDYVDKSVSGVIGKTLLGSAAIFQQPDTPSLLSTMLIPLGATIAVCAFLLGRRSLT